MIQQMVLYALLADLLIGDPRWLWHPIRSMGWCIQHLEPVIRRWFGVHLRLGGVFLWVVVVGATAGIAYGALYTSSLLYPSLPFVLNTIFIFYALAVHSLLKEGWIIFARLRRNDLEGARIRLQTIVSRDCSRLDAQGVIRGTIETLTENLSDGIVAPLLFAMIGGGPLALAYKAVNTLDSMVGYRDTRYEALGWFSAKADDVANYIPARLTGITMVLVAIITLQHPLLAICAWRRDAQKGPSPNGGIPIVVFAGLRDLRLGGDCFSKEGERICIPWVGGHRKEAQLRDIIWAEIVIGLVTALIVTGWFFVGDKPLSLTGS